MNALKQFLLELKLKTFSALKLSGEKVSVSRSVMYRSIVAFFFIIIAITAVWGVQTTPLLQKFLLFLLYIPVLNFISKLFFAVRDKNPGDGPFDIMASLVENEKVSGFLKGTSRFFYFTLTRILFSFYVILFAIITLLLIRSFQ